MNYQTRITKSFAYKNRVNYYKFDSYKWFIFITEINNHFFNASSCIYIYIHPHNTIALLINFKSEILNKN